MRLEDLRGQRFGRYEIVDVLGRGGMAAVYRARDTSLQRDVALKLLYAQYSNDAMLLERFRREAVLAAQLDHPNIVPIYDVGESNGVTYIAMKLMPGLSLADALTVRGRLPLAELQPVLTQIAGALDYAHGRGIVHRDIKPANILLVDGVQSTNPSNASQPLTANIIAMLSDFGIAKSLDSPGMTSTSVLIGTPDYMAPEQIRSNRSIDRRVDIYALAALAYRALTGQRLYDGNTQEVLLGHLNGNYTPASQLNPALPQALDAVFARGLALQPEDRYATAGDFVRELARTWRQLNAQQAPSMVASAPHRQPAADATLRGNVRPAVAQTPVSTSTLTPALIQARRRSRNSVLLLIGLGLISLMVIGAVLMKISATSQSGRPTDIGLLASATPEPTLLAETTTLPTTIVPTLTQTSTSAPTQTIAPSPSTTIAASATSAPTAQATQPRPTNPPPTAVPVPSRVPPSATSIPPSATSIPPSATPIPPSATSIPPSATACPIDSDGGFKLLWEQNASVRERMGCPRAEIIQGQYTAEQAFQRGSMYYFEPNQLIFVLTGFGSGSWDVFEQAALANRPTPTPAPSPGEGLYIPVSGFGLVWGYNADVRDNIGYGVEEELGLFGGAYQRYQGGIMLYSERGLGRGKTLYMLYNDGSFERFRDPN